MNIQFKAVNVIEGIEVVNAITLNHNFNSNKATQERINYLLFNFDANVMNFFEYAVVCCGLNPNTALFEELQNVVKDEYSLEQFVSILNGRINPEDFSDALDDMQYCAMH